MLKQSPSRNQRSKGFKLKHILQLCILLGVGIWLIYRVHGKKETSQYSSRQKSENQQGWYKIIKLGRKDLNPRVQEAAAENLKHRDEEDELESEEFRRKPEENGDEGRGVGYDEIDENDRDEAEEDEPEPLEDFIDEEDKEREEVSEQKDIAVEDHIDDIGYSGQNSSSVEENSTKAQEEHYEWDDDDDDDATDVFHDAQILSSGHDIGALRAMKEDDHLKNVVRNEPEIVSRFTEKGMTMN